MSDIEDDVEATEDQEIAAFGEIEMIARLTLPCGDAEDDAETLRKLILWARDIVAGGC